MATTALHGWQDYRFRNESRRRRRSGPRRRRGHSSNRQQRNSSRRQMSPLRSYSWPIGKLREGLTALASATGLDPRPIGQCPTDFPTANADALIEKVATALSIRAGRVSCALNELDDFFRSSAQLTRPALIES